MCFAWHIMLFCCFIKYCETERCIVYNPYIVFYDDVVYLPTYYTYKYDVAPQKKLLFTIICFSLYYTNVFVKSVAELVKLLIICDYSYLLTSNVMHLPMMHTIPNTQCTCGW